MKNENISLMHVQLVELVKLAWDKMLQYIGHISMYTEGFHGR